MRHHISQISLMHGWLPATVQAIAVAMLIYAIGWRSRRWRTLWLPLMVIAGAILAVSARRYVESVGVAGDPGPRTLWTWIGLTGLAGQLHTPEVPQIPLPGPTQAAASPAAASPPSAARK